VWWLYTGDCCTLQLFQCFNHLGVCHGVAAARRNIDVTAKESCTTLQQWRDGETERRVYVFDTNV